MRRTQQMPPVVAASQGERTTPKKENPTIDEIFDRSSAAGDSYTSEAARDINSKEVRDLAQDDYEFFLIGQSAAEGLSEEEHQTCRELVALLRSRFWLGRFIEDQLNYIKHGSRMNPAQVMCELAEPQREWRDAVLDARRVNRWWPEVLAKD